MDRHKKSLSETIWKVNSDVQYNNKTGENNSPLTLRDLKQSLKRMKNNKAPTNNGITAKVIKRRRNKSKRSK